MNCKVRRVVAILAKLSFKKIKKINFFSTFFFCLFGVSAILLWFLLPVTLISKPIQDIE